jgi:hypothetical protein
MERKKVEEGAAGRHKMHAATGRSRKSSAQTESQNARDPKGRRGQFGGAGVAPLIKK